MRIGSPEPGGPERGILDLGHGMAALGEPMGLAVLDDNRTAWDRLRAQYGDGPVPLLRVPMRGPFDPLGILRLARLARSVGADVLHAHGYKSDVMTRLAAPLARIPWVTTLHGVFRGDVPPLYQRLDEWATRHARKVFTVSARHAPGSVPVTVVPNVVPVPQHPLRSEVARPRRLVSIGRLEPQKGLDVLMRALAVVHEHVPDVSLTIVGDGSQREGLAALRDELRLGEAIAFAGWVPQVESVLDAADLLVLPSRWESQGRVVLEAMARGLPVVATRVGTVAKLVDDPSLGRLIDELSPRALAEALVWAAGQRFDGRLAWQRVRSRHAPEVLARIYLDAYRELGALPTP